MIGYRLTKLALLVGKARLFSSKKRFAGWQSGFSMFGYRVTKLAFSQGKARLSS